MENTILRGKVIYAIFGISIGLVLGLLMSGCCLSPYMKGCGMDDSARMKGQTNPEVQVFNYGPDDVGKKPE